MKESFLFTTRFVVERGARLFGERTALALAGDSESVVTYRELKKKSESLGWYLKERGIVKGDRVAIVGESTPNWAISYFGIITIGAVAVPILPDFAAKEMQTILEHSGSKAAVVSSKLFPKVAKFCSDSTHLVMRMDDLFCIPPAVLPTGTSQADFAAAPGRDMLKAKPDLETITQLSPAEDDLSSIIYTSGTTGASKGVMLTHKNITTNAYACRRQFVRIVPGYRMLSILPMSHSYEFTIGLILGLITGCQIHYLGKAPAASILLPLMKKVRPHIMLSVPLLIEKIYRSSVLAKVSSNPRLAKLYKKPVFHRFFNRVIGRKLKQTFGGRLKFFGIGGAALDPTVESFLKEARFPYAIGYGLTETSPLLAGAGPRQTRVGTTGFALNNVQLRIEQSGEDSQIGEIQAKGDNIMPGYYRNEEMTKETFTADGWFKTGDLGSIVKGRLSIRGRLKTMILGPGGENIYPELIEMQINNHEYVEESLVIPQEGGLTAMIKLNLEAMAENLKTSVGDAKQDAAAYLAKIRDEVNKDLSMFSRISNVHLQDEPFQRTPTMKIKRYLYTLKERIAHKHEADEGQPGPKA